MHVKYKLSAAWSYLCMYLSLGADIGRRRHINGGVDHLFALGSTSLRERQFAYHSLYGVQSIGSIK